MIATDESRGTYNRWHYGYGDGREWIDDKHPSASDIIAAKDHMRKRIADATPDDPLRDQDGLRETRDYAKGFLDALEERY